MCVNLSAGSRVEGAMEFTEAFDELAQLAYGMAFRVLGSRSEAEEVAQETLTKALVRWRRVQSHARPWVCRVAVNEAIGILRRRHDSHTVATVPRADGVADRVDLQRALLSLSTRRARSADPALPARHA